MAKCINCGRSVSYEARTCPGCGQPNPCNPYGASEDAAREDAEREERAREREELAWMIAETEARARKERAKQEAAKHAHYHRDCPMCAEEVKKKAKVCKHCSHMFDDHKEVMAKLAEDEAYAARHRIEPWRTRQHQLEQQRKAEAARLERQRLCREYGCSDDELDAVHAAKLASERSERQKAEAKAKAEAEAKARVRMAEQERRKRQEMENARKREEEKVAEEKQSIARVKLGTVIFSALFLVMFVAIDEEGIHPMGYVPAAGFMGLISSAVFEFWPRD